MCNNKHFEYLMWLNENLWGKISLIVLKCLNIYKEITNKVCYAKYNNFCIKKGIGL